MSNAQKATDAKTNGATSIDGIARDLATLGLVGRFSLNGQSEMFEVSGRNVPFYGVPAEGIDGATYFWQRTYGKLTRDDDGHLVMEIQSGSHVKGVPLAGRYMELERLYMFAHSTESILISPLVSGNRVEVIESQEKIESQENLPK